MGVMDIDNSHVHALSAKLEVISTWTLRRALSAHHSAASGSARLHAPAPNAFAVIFAGPASGTEELPLLVRLALLADCAADAGSATGRALARREFR